MNVAIYIYDEAEVLDFSGPFEVFSTAARFSEDKPLFTPFLVSENGGGVIARAGYKVEADYGFDNHPAIDVLLVVGGVHEGEMHKPKVIQWIAEQASKATIVASVCTGAFLLAKAGVIESERVTTHWQDIDDLRQQFPRLTVVDGVRWVDQGSLITSGGISAGIDMSLHLVSKIYNMELARKTARQMEFSWSQNAV